ncbi:agamous-like MADS-box protein AGL80 [Phoenix dactylifera]|uniref:Agamous-like MADS-box protein AGL80 n=1 Tax=Phoenix dactylifera TaxID=42345 RepID=A0A8B7D3X7_PHODC|nr:agamous-like MADS-box protein AGL80 [Phoenix dactylifera]
MARKKVNLAWIANDSHRRATLKKRRKGLVKKVSELSTLCDVKACLVVYSPHEPLPVMWPSVPEATQVVARFRSMPEMEQSKKMMDQEGFLLQRVTKLQDQLRRQERENRELETTMLMYEGLAGRSLHNAGMQDVTSLAWMVEMKMKMVHERIEMLRAQRVEASSQVVPAAAAPPVEGPVPVMKEKTPMEAAMEALERPSWFMDVMNPNDSMIYGGGAGMMQPYIDHTNPWLDPCYLPFK